MGLSSQKDWFWKCNMRPASFRRKPESGQPEMISIENIGKRGSLGSGAGLIEFNRPAARSGVSALSFSALLHR